jgi:serine/threonine protein kinase
MFQQEAVILAGLQHEGIPRVRDFFVDGTGCYLIMDLIEGNTLDECFKFNSLYSYLNIMVIGKEIAGILAYLHRRQIVFRDLKPSNIIKRSEDRKLFLIDFGISRLFKPGQAKDTATFGSAGYAAPEQHGAAQTDGRSDIYSLGATLYALFTGDDMANHPFRFDYDQIGHTQLREYIKQMTSIDREQRPASALDVQLEFQRMITKMAEPFPGTAKSIQS